MVVSQGANGNVYAYNYSSKTVCESTNWTACDISVHGHYPFRNLFEGNVILPALAADADSCPVIDVPASLYLADAPTFYCSCSWPMLADGQLVNPAAQRAQGVPSTPTPTPAAIAGTMAAINRLLLP